MNLADGFQLEEPPVLIPWGISASDLHELLPPALNRVTSGYYTLDCTSLSGLRITVGFRFRPLDNGTLAELEFFRKGPMDTADSFAEFQEHLTATFGSAHHQTEGDAGFTSYQWQVDSKSITHLVMDRFGPEEHVRIQAPRPLTETPAEATLGEPTI